MGRKREEFDKLTTSGEACISTLSSLFTFSNSASVSPEWIIVDAVTAVESHVDHALQSLIARSELPSSGIGSAFLARYSDDMTRTWDARYEWLSEGFGVKVKGKKFQQDFNVAVECRNAIVHGSGHLTKRQQSNLVKFVELRKQLQSILKIAAHGTEMIFSADSARNAVTVTSEFVHGFDEILLGATAMDY